MMRVALALCSVAIWSAARADGSCDKLVGTTVTPITIDAAIAKFKAATPKGEFETAAQYQSRLSSRARAGGGPLVIAKQVEDRKYLEYDADRSVLRIVSYAFQNENFMYQSAFESAGINTAGVKPAFNNAGVVFSRSQEVAGNMAAVNGFGAKFNLPVVKQYTKAVFDHGLQGLNEGLFPAADEKPYVVGTLRLSSTEAQKLKPNLKLAFLVEPKPPYLISGEHKPYQLNANNGDITEYFEILIADVQCGLLTDGADTVLGAYVTR